jgi:predicted dehydrogenase
MTKPPLRVGIVGANAARGWAKDAHVPALRGLPRFALAAVSARTRENAEAAAKAFDAPLACLTEELVRSPEVDVVAVTVRVPDHLPIVLAALEAGKHVYCEWPLGRNVEEATHMAEAAERAGVCAIVGLQGVASPAVREAASLVQAQKLGKPLHARILSPTAGWGPAAPLFYAYLNDVQHGATLATIAGGHTLAVVEHVLGPFVAAQAQSAIQHKHVHILGEDRAIERNCADHLVVLGEHASGYVSTTIVSGGSMAADGGFAFDVRGGAHALRIGGSFPGGFQVATLSLETDAEAAPVPPVKVKGPGANVAELYTMLAQQIDGGQRTAPDFRDAVRTSLLLETIDRAATSGQRQTLGEN